MNQSDTFGGFFPYRVVDNRFESVQLKKTIIAMPRCLASLYYFMKTGDKICIN